MEIEQERLGGGDYGGDQLGDDVVYFGELDMKPEERKRKFRKSDQYHLPNLEFPLEYCLVDTMTDWCVDEWQRRMIRGF
jgi:hypothetical protein